VRVTAPIAHCLEGCAGGCMQQWQALLHRYCVCSRRCTAARHRVVAWHGEHWSSSSKAWRQACLALEQQQLGHTCPGSVARAPVDIAEGISLQLQAPRREVLSRPAQHSQRMWNAHVNECLTPTSRCSDALHSSRVDCTWWQVRTRAYRRILASGRVVDGCKATSALVRRVDAWQRSKQ
jgi:hypothetical protein